MQLSNLLLLPFLLQGVAMLVDEFYFHHRRRLPRWERWGHPLDTLTVVLCFLFLLFTFPTQLNIFIYSSMATFSCLFVTKDEAMHLQYCSAKEAWLHALLFILHPLVLIAAGLIWCAQAFEALAVLKEFLFVLEVQVLLTVGFLIYQIGYWNFYAKKHID